MDEAKLLPVVVEKYFKQFKSIGMIAKEHNTYSNAIRRLLISNGYTLRNKSEAQSMSLKTGHHPHPTKGKKRSDEVKLKISQGLVESWENLSEDEKARRADISREKWNEMSKEEKEAFRRAASKAILKAAKEGSKIEQIIMKFLTEKGYRPLFHHELMFEKEKMQIDLYLPEIVTAIEIDGPTHYQPIWGEEKLAKQVAADNEKNGVLLSKGFNVVRVKYTVSKITLKYKNELQQSLEKVIKDFETKKKNGKLGGELVLLEI